MQVVKRQTAASDLLRQAFAELKDGDLRQASEKGWGAAASVMKALAEQRGEEMVRDGLDQVQRLVTTLEPSLP